MNLKFDYVKTKLKEYWKQDYQTWFGFMDYAKIFNSDILSLKTEAEIGNPEAIKIMDLLIAYKQRLETILFELLLYQQQNRKFFKNGFPRGYNFKHIEFLLKMSQEMKLYYTFNNPNLTDNVKLGINRSGIKLNAIIADYDTD